MSNGRDSILRRSARLINRAASGFYRYPEAVDGFIPEEKKLINAYQLHRPYGPARCLCYAPHTSMFFNTEGKALACCKNTRMVLGRYPENSLHEMWFGDPIKGLREHIRHYDLSNGCYKCREAIRSGNYGSVSAAGFDFLRAYPVSDYPRLLEFELSNRCNLECVMCSGRVSSSIRKKREHKEELKMPYDGAFVSQLEEFIPHLKQARFYGGEPFLIDLYYELWERILRINPAIDLYTLTNGTVLNERVKRLLDRGNFTVHVSVDSFQKELYEKIRVNAVFEETMENLHFFSDHMRRSKKQLSVYITPTRLNWEEIPRMIAQCNDWGMGVYFSPAYYPAELSLWNLPADDLKHILDHYRKADIPKGVNGETFLEMVKDIEFWYAEQKRNPASLAEKLAAEEGVSSFPGEKKIGIRYSEMEVYKSQLKQALEECFADEGDTQPGSSAQLLIERIERSIDSSALHSCVIYYFLNDAEASLIIRRSKEMTDAQLDSYLSLKHVELLEHHYIIEE